MSCWTDVCKILNVSDLHLCEKKELCKKRVMGELSSITEFDTDEVIESIEQKIKNLNLQKTSSYEELDIAISFGLTRCRINIYQASGMKCYAVRLLQNNIPSFNEINVPEAYQNLLKSKNGLILITGPTGSGKSTTLAASIEFINQHDCKHIITIEDPIEYIFSSNHSLIHQREVNTDTQSFNQALVASLREDPDVIMIGELRDLDTISTAIKAAETGHLVLATTHTKSATSTLDRLISVFPEIAQQQIRLQLADVLVGIFAQQLLPTLKHSRCLCSELLINSTPISNLIRENKLQMIPNTIKTSKALGMYTFEDCQKQLKQKGII